MEITQRPQKSMPSIRYFPFNCWSGVNWRYSQKQVVGIVLRYPREHDGLDTGHGEVKSTLPMKLLPCQLTFTIPHKVLFKAAEGKRPPKSYPALNPESYNNHWHGKVWP